MNKIAQPGKKSATRTGLKEASRKTEKWRLSLFLTPLNLAGQYLYSGMSRILKSVADCLLLNNRCNLRDAAY
jgi:hypothetical protein